MFLNFFSKGYSACMFRVLAPGCWQSSFQKISGHSFWLGVRNGFRAVPVQAHLSFCVYHYGTISQCYESVTFRYETGSADPYYWVPDPNPDPALLFSGFQSSQINSRNQRFFSLFAWWWEVLDPDPYPDPDLNPYHYDVSGSGRPKNTPIRIHDHNTGTGTIPVPNLL